MLARRPDDHNQHIQLSRGSSADHQHPRWQTIVTVVDRWV